MNTIEQAVNEYAAEKRRAYQREYRRTHPEKVKQYRKNAIRAAYRRLMEQEGGQSEWAAKEEHTKRNHLNLPAKAMIQAQISMYLCNFQKHG